MTLLELFQLLKKHLKLVIALPVICAVAMGIVSFTMMDSTYTATTSMYVLAKTDDSGQMSYNDLSASQMLPTISPRYSIATALRVAPPRIWALPIWTTIRFPFPPRPRRASSRFR